MDIKVLFHGFTDQLVAVGAASATTSTAITQFATGLTSDTRLVTEGSVFVAVRGTQFDGHNALEEVISKKPLALVIEDASKVPDSFSGHVFKVQDTRKALDTLASRFAGEPSKKLLCLGVTGTNGKTTLTHMVEWLFNNQGLTTGVMGTIDHHVGAIRWKTEMTTPGPVELQQRLADFLNHGAKAAALEISSHALQQARADSVQFDGAVFTNLTRDHLDYHKDMESYFLAKESLFSNLLGQSSKHRKFAVINEDDSWGKKIRVAESVKRIGYGQSPTDFQFQSTGSSFAGMVAALKTPEGLKTLNLQMVGHYNLANATAAIAVAYAAGLSIDESLNHIAQFSGVPGRLQRVGTATPYVFVDYAHTPDALQNVLESLQEVRRQSGVRAKIHCVFGCGGDRDKGKRPLMGAIACQLADEIWITSDNPRTELPGVIIDEVLQGVQDSGEHIHVIEDRKTAILECISQALPEDVILIAGKGHEDYQIIGKDRLPFSDMEIARKALSEKTV